MLLVSSCLLGLTTRYDGSDNYSQELFDYLHRNDCMPIPVCPEQLAGLATPRKKCWFKDGDGSAVLQGNGIVCDEDGDDRSAQFLNGAHQALKIARLCYCDTAILQQRSPSCGTVKIYQGKELTNGMGVTAALLSEHGIRVIGDDQLADERFVNHLHQK